MADWWERNAPEWLGGDPYQPGNSLDPQRSWQREPDVKPVPTADDAYEAARYKRAHGDPSLKAIDIGDPYMRDRHSHWQKRVGINPNREGMPPLSVEKLTPTETDFLRIGQLQANQMPGSYSRFSPPRTTLAKPGFSYRVSGSTAVKNPPEYWLDQTNGANSTAHELLHPSYYELAATPEGKRQLDLMQYRYMGIGENQIDLNELIVRSNMQRHYGPDAEPHGDRYQTGMAQRLNKDPRFLEDMRKLDRMQHHQAAERTIAKQGMVHEQGGVVHGMSYRAGGRVRVPHKKPQKKFNRYRRGGTVDGAPVAGDRSPVNPLEDTGAPPYRLDMPYGMVDHAREQTGDGGMRDRYPAREMEDYGRGEARRQVRRNENRRWIEDMDYARSGGSDDENDRRRGRSVESEWMERGEADRAQRRLPRFQYGGKPEDVPQAATVGRQEYQQLLDRLNDTRTGQRSFESGPFYGAVTESRRGAAPLFPDMEEEPYRSLNIGVQGEPGRVGVGIRRDPRGSTVYSPGAAVNIGPLSLGADVDIERRPGLAEGDNPYTSYTPRLRADLNVPLGRADAGVGASLTPQQLLELNAYLGYPIGNSGRVGVGGFYRQPLGPGSEETRPDYGFGFRGNLKFKDGGPVAGYSSPVAGDRSPIHRVQSRTDDPRGRDIWGNDQPPLREWDVPGAMHRIAKGHPYRPDEGFPGYRFMQDAARRSLESVYERGNAGPPRPMTEDDLDRGVEIYNQMQDDRIERKYYLPENFPAMQKGGKISGPPGRARALTTSRRRGVPA